MHSTFSDGSLTPKQLVERGRDVGLTAMALTDHDCTDGIDLFFSACGDQKPVGIPGVEISANVQRGTMHILGYFIDHKDSELQSVLQRIRNGREVRNKEILEKLNNLGLELAWKEVKAFAAEDVVGRPHFALAMKAKGFVASKTAAFDLYLAKGKPAYADRFRLSPADSMSAILNAGGVPVLSHPFTLDLDRRALRQFVGELKDVGLKGIEAYYSEYSREQHQEYMALARDFELAVTGGTDFHGEINPRIELGRGFGSLNIPDDLVDALHAAAPS